MNTLCQFLIIKISFHHPHMYYVYNHIIMFNCSISYKKRNRRYERKDDLSKFNPFFEYVCSMAAVMRLKCGLFSLSLILQIYLNDVSSSVHSQRERERERSERSERSERMFLLSHLSQVRAKSAARRLDFPVIIILRYVVERERERERERGNSVACGWISF